MIWKCGYGTQSRKCNILMLPETGEGVLPIVKVVRWKMARLEV